MKALTITILAAIVFSIQVRAETEDRLFKLAQSGNYATMDSALQTLAHDYGDHPEALQFVRNMFDTNETVRCTETYVDNRLHEVRDVRHALLIRSLARSLGDFHATLNTNELAVIYTLFETRIENDAMDALKALRGLHNPECVPYIIPELDNYSPHVARDTLRTLAVHGDKSLIPRLEVLTHDENPEVRADAIATIEHLKSKEIAGQ